MNLCINPQCSHPENPDSLRFCQSCGSALLLEGRYRVIEEMGKGGFAKTFEIEDNGTRKVLKVLHLNDPKPVFLFQQEARVLAKLNQPGIPKGYSYFTVSLRNYPEPLHCLVMEYVEGLDLRQWFEKGGNQPIAADLAIAWLRELATILHQVHQQQFFHRDIKPSNIMLKPDGQLALIDFGAAREVSQTYLQKVQGGLPVTGIVSAGYTAPEQAIGRAVPQSDFFALGRTFVYLLTGQEPTAFKEDPRSAQLMWRDRAPQVPPNLADFIDRLMAFSPSDRPQSTGDLLQQISDLDRTLPPASIPQRHPSSTVATLPVSPQQKHRTTTILPAVSSAGKWIAGGVLLLLVWVGVNLYQSERSRDPIADSPATIPAPSPTPTETPTPAIELPDDIQTSPSPTPTPMPGEQPTPPPPTPTPTPTPAPIPPPQPEPTPPPAIDTAGENIVRENSFKAHSDPVYAVAIAGNGEFIATGSRDFTVKLWDRTTGELRRTFDGHKGWIWAIATSPDGETLATASADSRIKLWDVRSGRERTLYGHRDQVHAIAFSPDGQTLASGAGGVVKEYTIKLWNVNTGEELRTIAGHTDTVLAIAYNPSGDTIASGSADGTIKIWDANTGAERRTLTGSSSYVNDIAFTPDGQTLVSSSGTRVNLWDANSGTLTKTLKGHQGEIEAISISPDGTAIASASRDKTVKLWDLQTGELITTLEAEGGSLRSLAFDSDRTLVAGTDNGTVNIWQVR